MQTKEVVSVIYTEFDLHQNTDSILVMLSLVSVILNRLLAWQNQ